MKTVEKGEKYIHNFFEYSYYWIWAYICLLGEIQFYQRERFFNFRDALLVQFSAFTKFIWFSHKRHYSLLNNNFRNRDIWNLSFRVKFEMSTKGQSIHDEYWWIIFLVSFHIRIILSRYNACIFCMLIVMHYYIS